MGTASELARRGVVRADAVARERRRIALVGGAGFIGHHLALRMAAEGWDVVVVDDLRINHIGRVAQTSAWPERERMLSALHRRLDLMRDAGVTLLTVDARDRERLAAALPHVRGGVLVHLAGVAHADRSDRAPYEAFDNSMGSLAASLEVARGGVERFVFLSSSMVYGDFVSPTAGEDHPLRPIGVYGALKLGGELLVQAHQRVFGLPCTIIRPSALYGPRCISQRVTQRFLERAAQGLSIHVEGDGTEKIDFTYVDDLVEGIRLAIGSEAARNETFNMTCGNARSLLELAHLVRRSFPDAVIEHVARPPLRPRRGTLSIEKARALLGYSPRVQLEEGLRRCVAAMKEETGSPIVGRGRDPGCADSLCLAETTVSRSP
jgi:nucleoside-diphosphate-sugar epimerase